MRQRRVKISPASGTHRETPEGATTPYEDIRLDPYNFPAYTDATLSLYKATQPCCKCPFKEIYPNDLELKCEHSGDHATFLDLDIKFNGGEFVYKLYDKRDKFPFFVVRMPDRSSNIPSYIFYGTIMSEIIRIARSTLLLVDLVPRIGAVVIRLLKQGANRLKILHQCKKPSEITLKYLISLPQDLKL